MRAGAAVAVAAGARRTSAGWESVAGCSTTVRASQVSADMAIAFVLALSS